MRITSLIASALLAIPFLGRDGPAVMAVMPPSLAQTQPCEDFLSVLEGVPHASVERRSGSFESAWPGEARAACEVEFVTNDSILAGAVVPSLDASPGTTMDERGWEPIPEIVADGPGTSVFGIRRAGARCVVQWDQPAYLDDDGEIVQSDTLTILVQCGGSTSRGSSN